MTIDQIKARLTLPELLKHYGLVPDRNSMLHCPFHEDKTPSLQVYYKTNTAYCFSANCKAHGKSMDVIDFILHKEGCTKHEAIEEAKKLAGYTKTPKEDIGRIAVLSKLMQESRQSLQRSPRAQSYCKERSLDPLTLEIGFLEERYHRTWNETLKAQAQILGLLKEQSNKTLSPVFRNCLVFGMKNKEGKTVSIYGRSITEKAHYYLKGKHQGLYPGYPKADTKNLILTESIIDAATLLQLPTLKDYSILALYGTNGLTEEHTAAIKELKQLQEIIFLLDGDAAGEEAIKKYSNALRELLPEAKISKGTLPEGEDVNSVVTGHEEGVMLHILKERTLIFSNEKKEQQPKEEASKETAKLNIENPDKIIYKRGHLTIETWGGVEKQHLQRLKLSLYLQHKEKRQSFRDDVNLYSNRSLKQFMLDAGEALEMQQSELKEILEDFTRAVEHYRLEEREKEQKPKAERVHIAQSAQEEAIKHLRDKHLIKHLRVAMQKTGLIGETDNGLLLFLIFLTRYFENPLHALVHGSSGSGKTNLLKTILKLVPEESKYETTALSENVLFRPPYQTFWKNKILLLEDLDGSYKALLPLREFMTAQKISKFVTETDPKTGSFRQVHLQAEGPVCIAGATTKDKIYEDNSNRSFLIHVNESKSHQEAVLDYQNKQAAGLIDKEGLEKTAEKIHNLQRMLDTQIKVVNPFQPQLKLPEYVFKKLRTNTHYITLIQSITFLYQYQREIKQGPRGRYIETTLEDIELANTLSKESLLRKSDELSGGLRTFFEALKHTVQAQGKHTFTAKEIRSALRIAPMQFNRRIQELQSRGYLKQTGGNQKLGYEYEVVIWDDYKVLTQALSILDETIEKLWKTYPDGKYNRSITEV